MLLASWLKNLSRLIRSKARTRRRNLRPLVPPIESLENRSLMSAVVVLLAVPEGLIELSDDLFSDSLFEASRASVVFSSVKPNDRTELKG